MEPIFFKNRKINEGSGIVLEILPMVLVLPRDKLEFETLRNLIEKPMEKAIADVIASLSKVCKKDVNIFRCRFFTCSFSAGVKDPLLFL